MRRWPSAMIAALHFGFALAPAQAQSASPSPVSSPSRSPSPSPRPSPSPSPTPTQSPPLRGSVTIHCPDIGDGTFAAVAHEARLFDAASTAGHALTALPTVGGPGAILLSDGALESGFDRWLALGATAQPQACDVDVTVAPGMPHDRYAVTSALPRTIVHDDRGGNTVRFLEIIYTEIARLGF